MDVVPAILREIRDEIRGTNTRLDQTNTRLDETNARLDETNARLTKGFADLGKRIDHLLTGPLGSTVRDLSDRMEVVEKRLDQLTSRDH